MAITNSLDAVRQWQKIIGSAALPMAGLVPASDAVPAYSAPASGTPDRGYVFFYKEKESTVGRVGDTGLTQDFRTRFNEFSLATEHDLGRLRAQLADLTQQVGELSRHVADNQAVDPDLNVAGIPTSDDEWATLFSITADRGAEPFHGVVSRAKEIFSEGRSDVLVIMAARALAAVERNEAKTLISQAMKKLKGKKLRERLGDIMIDYGL